MQNQTWGRGSFTTDTTRHLSPVTADSSGPKVLSSLAPEADLRRATIYNSGPNTVYVGGDDVTAATGFPVANNGSLDLVAHPARTWVICSTNQSATVRIVGA